MSEEARQGRTLTVEADDAGTRLDVWISAHVPDLSRSRIQALMRAGHIALSDGSVPAPHLKARAGMRVSIREPEPEAIALCPENIPLDILYEDEAIAVINKPAGLVVHPAPGHPTGTLVHALLYHCNDLAGVGGEQRPGIVHRLDKDTSGAIVIAKHDRAMLGLTEQFRDGTVRKCYHAIVYGRPQPSVGTISTDIGRSPTDRKRMSATPKVGKPAVTHYRLAEAFRGASLLEIVIETGRTHQIRVHMAHVGHPVVADAQYGGRRVRRTDGVTAPRQMLHAATLSLCHPITLAPMTFEAPTPADMEAVLEALRTERGGGSEI